MKSWKKIAIAAATLTLSASLVFSATACSSSSSSSTMSTIELLTEEQLAAWEEQCSEIYSEQLGEFYEAYQAAKAETDTATRYALMAIAEAKLLESAVMLPSTSSGGSYAITKRAPFTYPTVAWGTDSAKYHQALVYTDFLESDDIDYITDNIYYGEYYNTGSDYEDVVGGDTTATEYSNAVNEYLTSQGYTQKDSFAFTYSSNPTTWDILINARAATSNIMVNLYDGLVEYDELGNLQYALADQVYSTVDSDGNQHYYFHIRSGEDTAYWYRQNGAQYAAVTADDFVAGFQHMLDGGNTSGLYSLVSGIVKGVDEYISGEITTMDEVGVAAGTYDVATDTFTAGEVDSNGTQSGEWVEYTLEGQCSYFETLLTYNEFAPLCRSYYIAQGGGFGTAFNSSASGYNYGKDYESILYCGPYRITSYTQSSQIVFSANSGYWNADNININTITWYYNDGTVTTYAWDLATAGTVDYAALNDSAIQQAKNRSYGDGTYYSELVYTTETGSSTYPIFLNINRKAYANASDSTVGVTTKSELEAYRTNEAMQNVHFRRAVLYSIDRVTYNSMSVGDDLAATSLRNTYTPGNFVSLPKEVTVNINGEETTFEASTEYGEMVQAQLTADGSSITVWAIANDDGTYTTEGDGVYSTDGYDGWYNTTAAAAELEQAITELSIDGINVSSSNPIQIDYIYVSSNTTYTNMAYALKESIETATNGCVQVNLIGVSSSDDWQDSSYMAEAGYEMNFDISDTTGWGPDYGDPSTYLDTFLPDGAGYMTMMIGLWSN